jgi:hypothetical protein
VCARCALAALSRVCAFVISRRKTEGDPGGRDGVLVGSLRIGFQQKLTSAVLIESRSDRYDKGTNGGLIWSYVDPYGEKAID